MREVTYEEFENEMGECDRWAHEAFERGLIPKELLHGFYVGSRTSRVAFVNLVRGIKGDRESLDDFNRKIPPTTTMKEESMNAKEVIQKKLTPELSDIWKFTDIDDPNIPDWARQAVGNRIFIDEKSPRTITVSTGAGESLVLSGDYLVRGRQGFEHISAVTVNKWEMESRYAKRGINEKK